MKTAILLSNQFIMLNLDLVVDTLRIANRVVGSHRFSWQIFSADNRPVASCNNFVVQPDSHWPDSDDTDFVLVIAGFEPEQNLRRPVSGWLAEQHRRGVMLGCIDTGAFALAAAGVLDENPVAIHWEFEQSFRKQYPQLQVHSGGIACSDNFYSASGGLSVADMMLKLLEKYLDKARLDEVRGILYSHGSKPLSLADNQSASNPLNRIERAESHMHSTLNRPLALDELAGMINMHPRTFTRHFQQRYGMTPMRYYRFLRLNHARSLLLKTHWPVSRVAELCGFSEVSNFSGCFSKAYGLSPQQFRLHWLS